MKKVTSWKELTLREKIGQTVVCLCETDKHIEMCGSIEKPLVLFSNEASRLKEICEYI